MSPGLYIQPQQAPSPVEESCLQPSVHQNGFHKGTVSEPKHLAAKSAEYQNGLHSYCLRWIVRISNWYPSMEEWEFLLQLLPPNEARKVGFVRAPEYILIWLAGLLYLDKDDQEKSGPQQRHETWYCKVWGDT